MAIADDDNSSAHACGVQSDHADGGIVTYWRDATDARIQDPIVAIAGLAANTWFRFETVISKLTATSASQALSLVQLDAAGTPNGTPASAASGSEATVNWPGLADLTGYEWYVEVSDEVATAAAATFLRAPISTGPVA